MPESRLFMSSLSRRELARRRPGRAHVWRIRLLGVLLVASIVVVLLLEHGTCRSGRRGGDRPSQGLPPRLWLTRRQLVP